MILSWVGFILGIAAILLGNALEGGHIESLIQPTAALIVFGGTLGATLLGATMNDFVHAIQGIPKVFFRNNVDYTPVVRQMVELATTARREGLVALDRFVADIKNPFLASHLRHVVDGYDPVVLKEMMIDEIDQLEEEKMAAAKVWEAAGGFAPTIGILGAVLGLIHVMGNLSDSSKLGAGIAVAFVATVYGVGVANLVLLPIANKLKKWAGMESLENKIIFTGIMGMQNGLNPRLIEEQLFGLVGSAGSKSAFDRRVEDRGAPAEAA